VSFEIYRLWMTVLVFGEFHRIQIWYGLPEDFVLRDIPPFGLLEFEKTSPGIKGWKRVGIPDWAFAQVWEKTVKEKLK